MIQAEISIYPMATKTTSASFYIAKAIESIKNIDNLRYEINSMGTILESDNMDVINKASKSMIDVVHHLGLNKQLLRIGTLNINLEQHNLYMLVN